MEAICIFDPETGRILGSNAAFQRMLGYTAEESLRLSVGDLTTPRREDAGDQSGGGRSVGERTYRRKDGSSIIVEVSTSAIRYGERTAQCSVLRDDVKRRRLEKALKESEERFRSLTQNVSDVVTILEADGTVRYDSPAITRVLGYAPDERVGTSGFDYVHPEDAALVRESFEKALQSPGIHAPTEFRIRHKDGSWRYAETTRDNLLDTSGVRGVVTTLRDVTNRRRAEEALRESEERYRAVLEQSVEAIYLYDVQTKRVLESNRAFQEMMGFSEGELLGTRIYDFIDHEREDIDANVRRSLKEKRRYLGQRRYRCKDGSIIVVDTSASVIQYSGRTALCAVSRDITERTRLEEALRKSEANLAEAQRLAHLGSWEWDTKSGEVWWSDETYRIYGYEPREFAPTFEKLFEVVHPDDRDLVREKIDNLLHRMEPHNFEHRILRPDGEERVIHRRGEIVQEGGEPSRLLGTVHDITEQKRAEEALRESEERYRAVLEQSVEAIYLFDPDDKRVLESNAAFQKMIGYSSEELLGLTIYDFVAHDRENIDLNVERHILQERRFVGERQYRREDGSLLEVEASATVIPYYSRDAVCVVVRDVTERKALEAQLRQQAFHDSVSGLPNRALFLELLERTLGRARREGTSVAVLFVDLDNFKVVNDSLGHEAGNELLRAVGEDLRSSVRPTDTVARIFGDEFAVLLEKVEDVEEATRVAQRIEKQLHTPFRLGSREVFVTASIGIEVSNGNGSNPEDLLRNADLAMYAAKSRGKAHCEVFLPSMNTRALERMDLENDLRRAVRLGEFRFHYQPVVNLESGRLAGLEALVRWENRQHGMMPPSGFIEVAEQTGLIVPIGQQGLDQVCRQVREWQKEFGTEALPAVSVNLSTRQFFYQPELIVEVMRKTGVDPSNLRFEITERAVMDNAEFAIGKIEKMKGLGLSFAIDDFGTGYSCLHYLKRLPVDMLKIDGSFIEGLEQNREDVAIVSGTIALGHALNLRVVAERVENEGQVARLRAMGCDFAQGFYFSEPVPATEVSDALTDGHRWRVA